MCVRALFRDAGLKLATNERLCVFGAILPSASLRWLPNSAAHRMHPSRISGRPRWQVPSLPWPDRLQEAERAILELVGRIHFLKEAYKHLPPASPGSLYSRHEGGAVLSWGIVEVSQLALDIMRWLRGAQQVNAAECQFLTWMDGLGPNVEEFFTAAEAAAREVYSQHEAFMLQ